MVQILNQAKYKNLNSNNILKDKENMLTVIKHKKLYFIENNIHCNQRHI